jgi:hypothetical protein
MADLEAAADLVSLNDQKELDFQEMPELNTF